MNRNIIFGTLVLASSIGSAFAGDGVALAGDITIDPHVFVSTRSQAGVRAELAQYQQAGVNPWSASYNPLRTFRSEKTRAEVQQEYLASREQVRAFTGEDSGATWLAHHSTHDAGNQFAGEPAARAE
jgi:hypothetical protein